VWHGPRVRARGPLHTNNTVTSFVLHLNRHRIRIPFDNQIGIRSERRYHPFRIGHIDRAVKTNLGRASLEQKTRYRMQAIECSRNLRKGGAIKGPHLNRERLMGLGGFPDLAIRRDFGGLPVSQEYLRTGARSTHEYSAALHSNVGASARRPDSELCAEDLDNSPCQLDSKWSTRIRMSSERRIAFLHTKRTKIAGVAHEQLQALLNLDTRSVFQPNVQRPVGRRAVRGPAPGIP